MMRSARILHSRSPIPDPASPGASGLATPSPPHPRKAQLPAMRQCRKGVFFVRLGRSNLTTAVERSPLLFRLPGP